MTTIELVIFDLDDCILDTNTFRPHMQERMRQVMDAFEIPDYARRHAEHMLKTASPIAVARECDLPKQVCRALLDAYRTIDVPACVKTYGDEHHIADIKAECVLVTAGFESVQYAKIARVGIAKLFSEIHVVGSSVDHFNKQLKFQEILKERDLEPWQSVVVGDSPHAELRAGLSFGMITVQTLRPGVTRWDRANFHITSLSELPDIIRGMGHGES